MKAHVGVRVCGVLNILAGCAGGCFGLLFTFMAIGFRGGIDRGVIVPLALPGVIAVSIFTFIVAWNDYIFTFILITSDDLKTLPVGLFDIYTSSVTDWGMITAAGVVITLPALVFFVFVQRYLISGWGAGGVKG